MRECKRMKTGPSGLKRCASYGAAKRKGKKASAVETLIGFPNMRIIFDIEFEDYNVEDDLANTDEPDRQKYAKKFLKKFDEGAGWHQIQDEEMRKLSKILGFYCKAVDSESGEVSTGEPWAVRQRVKLRNVETLGDVLALWEAIGRAHGGGDDIIYLDQYVEARSFLLFPEGFNGPRYEYADWDEWLEEHGAL